MATNSRRVQFTLTASDAALLVGVRTWFCYANAVDAARGCLDEAVRGSKESVEYVNAVAEGAKLPRRLSPGSLRETLVRLSIWVRPEDREMLSTLMRRHGFKSMSEALRFAIRLNQEREI